MRSRMLVAVVALALVWLCGTVTQVRGAGQRGAGAAAPAVPKLATDKTMFWPAADIEARWKDNEAFKRTNSRLFDGPTNISANVRIVAGEDPPLVHETTADLWIVTAGTAVARTDGKLVQNGSAGSIDNATARTVRPGDVLYVPPGVPHHFTQMNGFRAWLMRFDPLGLVRTTPAPAAAAPAAPSAVPRLSTDKTMFWTAADIDARWKENEAMKRINSRIFDGPANISANVRIVLPNDPPQAHEGTADLWLVTAGEAVARTDGQIVDANGAKALRNGKTRTVSPCDLLEVPARVPHHFTDTKGFRAWLIRYDVEGWSQSIPPAGRGGAQ